MKTRFGRLLIKLRGALGLTVTGGLAGSLIGAALALIEGVVGVGPLRTSAVILGGTRFAILGASAGLGFSVLLGSLRARHRLEEVSTWSAAVMGAVAGGLFPAAFFTLSGWAGVEGATILGFFGISGVLGAAFGSAVVAVAKRAEQAKLRAADPPPRLPGG